MNKYCILNEFSTPQLYVVIRAAVRQGTLNILDCAEQALLQEREARMLDG